MTDQIRPDSRIRQVIDKWLCNTAINRMRFAEDASELTDLPIGLLRLTAESYTVEGSDAEVTLHRLIKERENAAKPPQ